MSQMISRLFRRGQFTGFVALLVLITVLSILASFFPLWVNVPLHVLLPIYILLRKKMVMFEKLKLSTLVVMRALIVLVLFGLMSGEWYIRIVLIFLIINILEATFTDLLKNKMYFNFVTGLVLAGSVLVLGAVWVPGVTGPLSGIYHTYVTSSGGSVFLLTSVKMLATLAWIVAYTIWNWLFVIGEFSPSIGYHHVAILSSPILSSLILWNPGYWLVMRANSLTAGGIIQIVCKDTLERELRNEALVRFIETIKGKGWQIALMLINLLLIGYSVLAYFS